MDTDFRTVKAMSEPDVERAAESMRKFLHLGSSSRVSMANLVERVLGEVLPGYIFTVQEDEEMLGREGYAGVELLEICLSDSTYRGLHKADPEARRTTAYELGHLLLHSTRGTALAKRSNYDQRIDPEWRADCFADAFLMPRAGVLRCESAEELAEHFSVPLSRARDRFSKVHGTQGELFA